MAFCGLCARNLHDCQTIFYNQSQLNAHTCSKKYHGVTDVKELREWAGHVTGYVSQYKPLPGDDTKVWYV